MKNGIYSISRSADDVKRSSDRFAENCEDAVCPVPENSVWNVRYPREIPPLLGSFFPKKNGIYTISVDKVNEQHGIVQSVPPELISDTYSIGPDVAKIPSDVAENSAKYPCPVPEDGSKQLRYPRSMPPLLVCMFLERVATNGLKTVLVLFLTTHLLYDTDSATIIYHAYMTLAFFTAICGAIMSDSWLGRYYSIVVMYLLGLFGMFLLNLSSVHWLQLPEREISVAALVIVALGIGSMKPCIVAFGGDQYQLPEQLSLMSNYFSMVYFTLKLAAFVGTAITPMLRTDFKCLGDESCYLLAFGVSGAIFLASMISFVVGKCLYAVRPSSGNIIAQVIKCSINALVNRIRDGKSKVPDEKQPDHHWLDYAVPRYGLQLVHDTKILFNILVVYIPIPFYWALNEQTGSRWTLQATRMNGNVADVYTIEPDQMQVVMQVLLIVFIPLFQTVLYPSIARIGIRGPLHKIALAMVLAGTAFVVAGLLETRISADYAIPPEANSCQLRVYNTWQKDVHIRLSNMPTNDNNATVIRAMDTMLSVVPIDARDFRQPSAELTTADVDVELPLSAGQAISYYYDGQRQRAFADDPQKSLSQWPRLRVLVVRNASDTSNLPLTFYDTYGKYVRYTRPSDSIEAFEVAPSKYLVQIGGQQLPEELTLQMGSVSTLLVVQRSSSEWDVKLVQLTPANSVHMLWMIPQYALLAAGEAIMGVTGMFFAYSESPESMKTVLQACWLLTIALGHLIDVIVVGADLIDSQIYEFFMFAAFMVLNIILFMWLVNRYRPLTPLALENEKAQLSTAVPSPRNSMEMSIL